MKVNSIQINERLEKASGNSTDIYHSLYYDFLQEKGDEAVEALKVILEYPYDIGDKKDDKPSVMSTEEELELYLEFEDIIVGVASRLAKKNYTKEEFYVRLYKEIFCADWDLMPQRDNEKIIALRILSEVVQDVPYFEVKKGIEITRKEFDQRKNSVLLSVREANYMLFRYPFPNWTTMASQIYRIEQDIEDEKDRVVFWAMVIHMLSKKNKQDKE